VLLPVGDCALLDEEGIQAVVERKTFENVLAEFGRMPSFHQQLGELESYAHSALVIEANYSNFLKPEKLKFYPPSFIRKAVAEIFALHPPSSYRFCRESEARPVMGGWLPGRFGLVLLCSASFRSGCF